MRTYKSPASEDVEPLIPISRTQMFSILTLYKTNKNIQWPIKGRRPVLNNSAFLSSISEFERDEGRAIAQKDLKQILKSAKEDDATKKGNSTLTVVTPTKRSIKNYENLLLQLDPARGKSKKVVEKSDARYIAERSVVS